MGYVVKKTKIIKLVFADDHELAGIEIRSRSMPGEQALELAVHAKFLADTSNLGPEELLDLLGKIKPLVDAFAERLISWNLEEEPEEEGGQATPLPATAEGLASLPLALRLQLVGEWFQQVIGVSQELGKGSVSGVAFPEPSLPMVPRSPSLESLSVPS